MVQSLDNMVQRGHRFAIVDEVDSVLIDEARTPLIISAPDMEPTDKYYKFAELIQKLNPDTDFTVDEKTKSASLTEHGIARMEKILGVVNLYEKDFDTIHHMENALRAKTLFKKDTDYIVKDDQVIIVDENTGRLMFGRRWSDGMHQAVEAKEGVKIQQESKTLATISFQNYFRMYDTLSGMTGTAATEAEEFKKIYKLDVIVIPTHRDNAREDSADVIYKNLAAKYTAVAAEISKMQKKGQPVLVGTTSIEKNEIVSSYLKRKKIPHNLLNAKNHEKEALIISDAGRPGSVTVATNMAGRGVDIVLGGSMPETPEGEDREKFKKSKAYKKWKEDHDKVVKAGGLHVLGTERHQSRRIDNQLRGRSGRQGDPGSSRFYLSLDDDLMRIFGGDQIRSLMERLKLPEDQPIENRLISRAIEQAQVKVEGFNFDARKNVVEYDDVINQQRTIVYNLRKRILESEDLKEEVLDKLKHQIEKTLLLSTSVESEDIEAEKVVVGMLEIIPFDDASRENIKEYLEKVKDEEKIKEFLFKMLLDIHSARENQLGEEIMRKVEKFAYLGAIDHLWIAHIDAIDGLREGVRLRGYAQRDPISEFKNEAYTMFEALMEKIDEELSHRIFRIGVSTPPAEIPLDRARTNIDPTDQMGLADASSELTARAGEPAFGGLKSSSSQGIVNSTGTDTKIGRNDPCPCGAVNPNNGKPYKYKKCGLVNAPYHKG
jgi:preprotein translocase subunit SecA